MDIKLNRKNDECFCTYCKSRIFIGEKYAIVSEDYYGETIKKEYHLECVPAEEDEDDDIYYNC